MVQGLNEERSLDRVFLEVA
jgi:hypothetical protein